MTDGRENKKTPETEKMHPEENRKQQLFRAIGGIQDYYIYEAEETVRQRRMARRRRNYTIACIAAAVSLVILTVSVAQNRKKESAEDVETEIPASETVTRSILSQADCSAYAVSEVDFYDGNLKFIWTYGDGTLYCRNVSENEAGTLVEYQKGAAKVKAGEQTDDLRLWICDRDGIVETPFLSSSDGNTGFGQIFDYEPEYEMTDATERFLSGLLT